MKKTVIAFISVFITAPLTSINAAEKYTIDPDHTYPHFKISHLGFSTMHGRFNKTKGSLTIDRKNNTGSVEIVIDANSVDTAHEKRDKHLRSNDFLNVAEFPEITFKSTKVTLKGDKADVDGKLTIMGVSKPVSLKVTHIKCGTHPFNKKEVCGFDAETSIKRSDFGIKYGLPAIGDEMKILIEAEGVKG